MDEIEEKKATEELRKIMGDNSRVKETFKCVKFCRLN